MAILTLAEIEKVRSILGEDLARGDRVELMSWAFDRLAELLARAEAFERIRICDREDTCSADFSGHVYAIAREFERTFGKGH